MVRVVAYGSRALHRHERNYCATRLEMLALVDFIDHFRYYLLGRKFLVRKDNHALRWLMSFKQPEGQVARWLERRQEYDFTIEHRPGKSHAGRDENTGVAHRVVMPNMFPHQSCNRTRKRGRPRPQKANFLGLQRSRY